MKLDECVSVIFDHCEHDFHKLVEKETLSRSFTILVNVNSVCLKCDLHFF